MKMLQHVLRMSYLKYMVSCYIRYCLYKIRCQFEENIINILNNINSGLQLIQYQEQEFKDFIPRIKGAWQTKKALIIILFISSKLP